ncbi:zinc transporter ZIP1 [Drosophila rhopaloa]|uniref:Zinc transporter ZIP1 n=1 Tax=Drosophila rhopaloa TaxID=1041015 RepID=A0A6P4FPC6_DRORH|nr:zinc transporter ZIP1 [Drosophila rhopaloa]
MDGAGSMSKEQSQNGDRQSLLVAKIVAMVVLVVITVLCGSLPYVLNRCFQWTKQSPEETRSSAVVRCLLFFGGGVLICTTFLHMLPEVIEVVEALQQCGSLAQTPFALTEMLLCTGFFLMYALDELMTNLVRRHQRKLSRKESVASLAFERGRSIRHSVLLKNEEKATPPQQEVKELEPQPPKDHHGHSHMPVPSGEGSGSSARGLGIILALSLHELFEGMAIGLEGTVSTVWFMFGAVAAHKLVLAFCVGMELLVARTRSSLAIVYLVTFSIVTPIGIGVGLGISQQVAAGQPSLPSGILQGIACGTLLYVVFFEILTESHAGWRALIAAVAGFSLMFGLQILSDEAEGDDSYTCP